MVSPPEAADRGDARHRFFFLTRGGWSSIATRSKPPVWKPSSPRAARWSGASTACSRRRKLGLADAVATDRIRLWALALLASLLATTTAAVCQSAGIPLVGTTGGLWLSGAAAAAASACLWLAFLPPAAYLARVRRSAAAA
jgi:hypothetical protein